MSEKYQELRRYLLMDWWPEEETLALLLGYGVEWPPLYGFQGDPSLFRLSDGERVISPALGSVPGPEHAEYMEVLHELKAVRAIWDGSGPHLFAFGSIGNTAGKLEKDYCIKWAIKKQIEIPWLDWAVENDYLPSLNGQSDDPPPPPKPESEREKKNRLRLVAVMLRLLTDPNQKRFTSDAQLIEHVTDEDNPVSKIPGISRATLQKVFKEAKDALDD